MWAVPEEQPCQRTNHELMYAGHCELPKFGVICMQQKLSDRFTKKSFPPDIPVENGHHQLKVLLEGTVGKANCLDHTTDNVHGSAAPWPLGAS